ncbi:MAG: hypothetical protein CMN30_08990 [Sandaracinus sp.]|mgnify:CR=1 FL=1|nr:hypothetical protein [Sandaracinus sp.]
MRALAGLLAVALLGGCAAASRPAASAPAESAGGAMATEADVGQEEAAEPMGGEMDEDESMQLMDDLGGATDDLDRALNLADCPDAYEHRDAICALGERICTIAEDHPRAQERCLHAEERCAAARERVSDACD